MTPVPLVLHCCLRYFPNRGGSETYVSSLIAGLGAAGVGCRVAALGRVDAQYEHDGVPVNQIAFDPNGNGAFLKKFCRLLDDTQPDLVHFHARSPEWSAAAVSEVRERGFPAILTYHISTLSCLRGTMMRFGRQACSGRVSPGLCTPCVAHSLGAPRPIGELLQRIPKAVLRAAVRVAPSQRVRTALALPGRLEDDLQQITDYLAGFNTIVVISAWSADMLAAIGVSPDRIVLQRLGTHHRPPQPAFESREGRDVRGLYVGRLHTTKGIGLLCKIAERVRDLPVTIDVFGPPEDGDPTARRLMSAPIGKMTYRGALPDHRVVDVMAEYDFALVPSQVLETGPYTVVEALQAGIPVIGSDLPAVNELVRHNVNGLLIGFDDVDSWVDALRRVSEESDLIPRLRANARYDRTMGDVAGEMADVYRSLLAVPTGASPSQPGPTSTDLHNGD